MLKPNTEAYRFDETISPVNEAIITPSSLPVLTIRDVSVTLDDRTILKNVSLNLRQGEILAIIGPSGCGKTTFIATLNQMIAHTLPTAQVTGSIRLNGHQIFPGEINAPDLRREIAMVFQRPNPFPFSIRKNMEFALKADGRIRKSGFAEKIEQALTAVNLWEPLKDRLNEPANCLSGGEQQRLCIARALLGDPKVILFDEPCSALDPISCTVVEELIAQLKTRCAVIIVTHNLAQARRVSDRCAFFWPRNGYSEVVETGSTEQIMTSPKEEITRMYVGGQLC